MPRSLPGLQAKSICVQLKRSSGCLAAPTAPHACCLSPYRLMGKPCRLTGPQCSRAGLCLQMSSRSSFALPSSSPVRVGQPVHRFSCTQPRTPPCCQACPLAHRVPALQELLRSALHTFLFDKERVGALELERIIESLAEAPVQMQAAAAYLLTSRTFYFAAMKAVAGCSEVLLCILEEVQPKVGQGSFRHVDKTPVEVTSHESLLLLLLIIKEVQCKVGHCS